MRKALQRFITCLSCLILLTIGNTVAYGNVNTDKVTLPTDTTKTGSTKDSVEKKAPKKWYEIVNIRGYAQIRYNQFLATNPDLKCEQCDRSWGDKGGVFLRRVRIIFSGNVNDRISFYVQPDFASAAGTGQNFTQLRDAYFDVFIDKNKESRIRVGQSKIPFGFENLQSSQNRLPLDRNDGINSALTNERDLGLFYYWAPTEIRERFAYLVSSGLKGSGDYGVFGFGVFNGQTANRPEANNRVHTVARVSYPFKLKNGQFIEAGIQAYTGKFVLQTLTPNTPGINPEFEYLDQRVAASLIIYPQPFGFQAEYNIGKGPKYNPTTNTIDEDSLQGGYAMALYMAKLKKLVLTPFVRFHYYDGGKKAELDARKYLVREFEGGAELQLFKFMEMTASYTISNRTFEDAVLPNNIQKGELLRLQLQFSF